MVSQKDKKKRRVSADKAAQRQAAAAERAHRRRRIFIGLGVGLLAIAMIAPLTAGLIVATADDPVVPPVDTLPTTTTDPPTLVDPEFAGATLNGPTPCPAVDGTQERITTFVEAPPSDCIDPAATYQIELDTPSGFIDIKLDPEAAPEAANLFVTLARYGVYEGAPVTPFDGLTVLGGWGNAGFRVPSTEPPADGLYPVGSVVMLAELGDPLMAGRVVLVTSARGAETLELDPTSPIIGTVTSDLAVIDDLNDLAASAAGARVDAVRVTERAS